MLSYTVDVVWFMRLNVNWYGVSILISTSQPSQIAHDVHEFHIHEVLICIALHEALAKNKSLQSDPQRIIKLTYKGRGNMHTNEFVITSQNFVNR